MKTLIILFSIVLFSCCTKEDSITPDEMGNNEFVDVHFKVTGEDRDVMKHIVFGADNDLHAVDITGDMDAVIPMTKGSYQSFTLYITSDREFKNTIEITSGDSPRYKRSNTCSFKEYGVKNQLITI